MARHAARQALDDAQALLGQPRCGTVLDGFSDGSGRPLEERLRALSGSLQAYLGMVVFIDGSRERPCSSGVVAFTQPGSRVVRLCLDELKRTAQRDPHHLAARFIHEMLHTLGLGEDPPSSAEITRRVLAACPRPSTTPAVSEAPATRGTGKVSSEVPWSTFAANAVFRPVIERLWQSSATFRQQGHRLATSGLRVRIFVEDLARQPASFTARSVIAHRGGAPASADIYLRPSPDVDERLGHELEHVLEQLDGVDLQAQAGNGVVWNNGAHEFETRRAIEAGRAVARESGAGPDRQNRDDSLAERTRIETTLRQRDPGATPWSAPSARVSGNGRYITFVSSAALVEADRNAFDDIYVRDLVTGQLTVESMGPGAAPANGGSHTPDISADGRYVVFVSASGTLTGTPILPGTPHIYLRDHQDGTTRLLTTSASGASADGHSRNPAISADGTVVVFESTATDPST